jgi:hypothetical protein
LEASAESEPTCYKQLGRALHEFDQKVNAIWAAYERYMARDDDVFDAYSTAVIVYRYSNDGPNALETAYYMRDGPPNYWLTRYGVSPPVFIMLDIALKMPPTLEDYLATHPLLSPSTRANQNTTGD